MMGMAGEKKYTVRQIVESTEGYNFGSEIDGEIDVEVNYTRPWSLAYTNITKAKITTLKNRSGYSINDRTFSFCHYLTDFLLIGKNDVANGIGTYALWDCVALTRVRLVGNIKFIVSNSFGSCSNLTDIYVSFAEGEVGGAPWGATNATIHYNTVFDAEGNIIN